MVPGHTDQSSAPWAIAGNVLASRYMVAGSMSSAERNVRRVLVTGATGFIGKHLVRALVARNDVVRCMGRNPRVLDELASWGCELVRGDLRDAALVSQACEGIDCVCHVGALSSPWGRKRDFLSCNVAGTTNVLAGCRTQRVARCVYISSPSVTSTTAHIVDQREDQPFPQRAISTYSYSKRLAEDLVRNASWPGFNTVILRPKAVFGPGDQALLPRLLRAAQQSRLRQIGDGQNRVDLTYVGNVVDAILLAITQPGAAGQTFLITNDEHPLLWELIRSVCRELGYSHRFRSIPLPVAWAAATGMEWRARVMGGEPLMTRYSVTILAKTQTYDITWAKERLTYRPRVSLADGIALTLDSMRRS